MAQSPNLFNLDPQAYALSKQGNGTFRGVVQQKKRRDADLAEIVADPRAAQVMTAPNRMQEYLNKKSQYEIKKQQYDQKAQDAGRFKDTKAIMGVIPYLQWISRANTVSARAGADNERLQNYADKYGDYVGEKIFDLNSDIDSGINKLTSEIISLASAAFGGFGSKTITVPFKSSELEGIEQDVAKIMEKYADLDVKQQSEAYWNDIQKTFGATRSTSAKDDYKYDDVLGGKFYSFQQRLAAGAGQAYPLSFEQYMSHPSTVLVGEYGNYIPRQAEYLIASEGAKQYALAIAEENAKITEENQRRQQANQLAQQEYFTNLEKQASALGGQGQQRGQILEATSLYSDDVANAMAQKK